MANLKRVYPHSFETARDNGELQLYHKNTQLNRECAGAIDKAVRESNYEMYHYDLKSAVQKVCDEFGPKRVAFVLASIVRQHEYDGRYSQENKAWAQTIPATPEQHYVCNTHPTILDDMVKKVRTLPAKERKPSVVGQLQDGKKAAEDNQQTKPTSEVKNTAQALNGEIACFDLVLSTGDTAYAFLVGEVNAVEKLGSPEHDSENLTDDVFVDFQSEQYSESRVKEIEAHFSKLYGEPKRFEDIPLDNVIMPPNSLIRISERDLSVLLESRENAEAFCNQVLSEAALGEHQSQKPSIIGKLKEAANQSAEPKPTAKKTKDLEV